MTGPPKTASVVIIGGGVMGASTAIIWQAVVLKMFY